MFRRKYFLGIFLNSNDQVLIQHSIFYRAASLMSVVYLLIFPLSSTILPLVSGVFVALIVVSSVVLYLYPLPVKSHQSRDERLFYFSVSFMVIVAILVTILPGLDPVGIKKLGKFVYLLMVIPLYLYFKAIRVKQAYVWYGLALGAIASAIVGVYEVASDAVIPRYFGRANGATHPIIFGDLALIMGAMSLAGIGWFKSKSRWHLALPFIAAFSGIIASILSQSRGGWVAIPFISAVFIWYSVAHISRGKLISGVSAVIALFVLSYIVPQTGLEDKIQTTISNVQAYTNADVDDQIRGTSIGSRFEMWQASLDIFLENPIVGVGWGNFQESAEELVNQGKRNQSAGDWDHPHNQFLSAMVSGGVLALIAVILLFLVPAKIFYTACKAPDRSLDAQRMALAGLTLVVGFAVFNLSESFLERSRTVSFYIFYLAVFMAGIREKVIEPSK